MRHRKPDGGHRGPEQEAVQLTLYVAEPHVGDRRSKVDQLLRSATKQMTGATVLAAHQGFGRRHSHEPTIWHGADEVPLTVIIIDEAERIHGFLTDVLPQILPDVVAMTSRVRVIRYAPAPPAGAVQPHHVDHDSDGEA